MREIRYDDSERIKMGPTIRDIYNAVHDPNNARVEIHNAPPVDSIVAGRIVTEQNRGDLYLAPKGVWRWQAEPGARNER